MPEHWIKLWLLITSLSMTLLACYEPIDGCLDPLSKNYDLTADDGCSECCTYPTLGMGLTHRWGEEALSTDSTYLNGMRQAFRLIEASFLVHDISVRQSDILRSSSDSINVSCDMTSVFISDSYRDLSLAKRSTSLSEFRSSGIYDQFNFSLGMSECVQAAELTDLDQESATYSTLIEYQNEDNSYTSMSFQLIPSGSMDTLSIDLNNAPPINIALETVINQDRGDNLIVPIVVDYAVWLSGISLDMTTEELKQSILNNTRGAFSVLE